MTVTVIYKTFDEIVDELVGEMDGFSRQWLAAAEEKHLIGLHHTTGSTLRNKYHLWDSNNPLIVEWYRAQSTGDKSHIDANGCDAHPCHPDAVSMDIIKAVWRAVNGTGTPKSRNLIDLIP